MKVHRVVEQEYEAITNQKTHQDTHIMQGDSCAVHKMKGSPVRQLSRKKSKEVNERHVIQQYVKGEMAEDILQKYTQGMARVVKL